MTNELKREQGIVPTNTTSRSAAVASVIARVSFVYTLGVESVKTTRQSAGAVPALTVVGLVDRLSPGLKTGGNAENTLFGSLETPIALGVVEGYGELDETAWQITELDPRKQTPLTQAMRPAVVAQGSDSRPTREIRVDLFTTSKVPLEEPIRHIVERLNQGIQDLPVLPEDKALDRAA